MNFTIAGVMAGLFAAGVIIGVAMHARLAAKADASKLEISSWLMRLRTAIASEEQAAKDKLRALAADIEKKL